MQFKNKLGWEKDLPDIRDYTDSSIKISNVLDKSVPLKAVSTSRMPVKVDLRGYCSRVEDQGDIGSCTANAGVGLLEYYQRRTKRKSIDGSRLFLYKTTRNLLGWTGDQGAYLRTTMKAMTLFGVPPEEVWPYKTEDFDKEPSVFVYSYAQNFQALNYYKLDHHGASGTQILTNVKRKLAAGLPSMFGFVVYASIYETGNGKGDIAFPKDYDYSLGGHAVVAIGYDDSKIIDNRKGALIIRNSWGSSWGRSWLWMVTV